MNSAWPPAVSYLLAGYCSAVFLGLLSMGASLVICQVRKVNGPVEQCQYAAHAMETSEVAIVGINATVAAAVVAIMSRRGRPES